MNAVYIKTNRSFSENVSSSYMIFACLYFTDRVIVLQVKAAEDRADMTGLVKELQEARTSADSTKDELNNYRQHNEKLQEEIQVREVSISKLKEELQEVRKNVDTTKEELNGYRQHNEKLQGELSVREVSLSQLKEELQLVRTAMMKTANSTPTSPSPSQSPLPPSSASTSSTTQPKRKVGKPPAGKGSSAKDKPSISRKTTTQTSTQSSSKSHSPRLNSSSEQKHVAVTSSFTQTEAIQMSDESPSVATKEEMEEVIGEFQEKIAQMQELHAAEILDMEARHITESDTLRRDIQNLEDECKALKTVIDKLRSTEVRTAGSSPALLSGQHYIICKDSLCCMILICHPCLKMYMKHISSFLGPLVKTRSSYITVQRWLH